MAAFVARYAYALADVVTEEKLDTEALERQINDFLAAWDASAELRGLFTNPVVDIKQKLAVLDKLNAQLGMQKELRNLLAVLIKNDRIHQVHEVAEAYQAEMQSRRGIRPVEIVTARALSEQERSEMVTGVGKLAGAPIAARFKLDASILGGTVVRIGSTVFDGSVRGRLERLKEALIAG